MDGERMGPACGDQKGLLWRGDQGISVLIVRGSEGSPTYAKGNLQGGDSW